MWWNSLQGRRPHRRGCSRGPVEALRCFFVKHRRRGLSRVRQCPEAQNRRRLRRRCARWRSDKDCRCTIDVGDEVLLRVDLSNTFSGGSSRLRVKFLLEVGVVQDPLGLVVSEIPHDRSRLSDCHSRRIHGKGLAATAPEFVKQIIKRSVAVQKWAPRFLCFSTSLYMYMSFETAALPF